MGFISLKAPPCNAFARAPKLDRGALIDPSVVVPCGDIGQQSGRAESFGGLIRLTEKRDALNAEHSIASRVLSPKVKVGPVR